MKATDFTLLMRDADDEEASETSEIPSATTKDVQGDGTAHAKSDGEINEELIPEPDKEMRESLDESIFRDLPHLVEMVVQSATQTLPTKTSTAAFSGSGISILFEATSGTDAHIQNSTPGT
uniref:Polyprotein protein n=1 Tax=Solanum tuberosum TaxID=4113 RepID=M1DQP0_SOLTU